MESVVISEAGIPVSYLLNTNPGSEKKGEENNNNSPTTYLLLQSYLFISMHAHSLPLFPCVNKSCITFHHVLGCNNSIFHAMTDSSRCFAISPNVHDIYSLLSRGPDWTLSKKKLHAVFVCSSRYKAF